MAINLSISSGGGIGVDIQISWNKEREGKNEFRVQTPRGAVFCEEKLPSELVGMMMACTGASLFSSSSTSSLCWSSMGLRPGGGLTIQRSINSFYWEMIPFGEHFACLTTRGRATINKFLSWLPEAALHTPAHASGRQHILCRTGLLLHCGIHFRHMKAIC